MSSRFIRIAACPRISLHLMAEYCCTLYTYTTFCVSNHLFMEIRAAPPPWPLRWTWPCTYLFESYFQLFWDIHPEVEFLDHMMIPLLSFWWISILFPQWLDYFIFLPTEHKGINFSTSSPIFSHPHKPLLFWLIDFFIIAVPMNVKCIRGSFSKWVCWDQLTLGRNRDQYGSRFVGETLAIPVPDPHGVKTQFLSHKMVWRLMGGTEGRPEKFGSAPLIYTI